MICLKWGEKYALFPLFCIMNIPKYHTDRLLLRPTLAEDAPLILALLNTPKWLENIGDRHIHTIKDAEQYIALKMTPQYERLGFGNFTVIRKSDGAKMGTCGLYDRDGLEGVDIGFAFLPEFERQGYGYESAKKIQQLGFEIFGVTKISAITTPSNIASQKLIEKLGLTFIQMIQLPDEDVELMLYEVTKDEY